MVQERRCPVVVREALEHDLRRGELRERERAGADQVLAEVGAPFLDAGRRHGPEAGRAQVVEEEGERLLEPDADLVVAQDVGPIVRTQEPDQERLELGIDHPVERGLDRGPVERRPVVELHLLAQRERVAGRVQRHLPRRGQSRKELARLGLPHERVQDRVQQPRLGVRVGHRWIEGVLRIPEGVDQRPAPDGLPRGGPGREQAGARQPRADTESDERAPARIGPR